MCECVCRLKRGSSRGFILEQDSGSMSDQFPEEEGVWLQERQWIEKFRARETGGKLLSRGLTSESSKYSFSIDGSEGNLPTCLPAYAYSFRQTNRQRGEHSQHFTNQFKFRKKKRFEK